MGFHDNILDGLAERQLDRDELRELLVLLFGKKAMLSAPDVHSEWKEFYDFLNKLNRTEGKHWKAKTGRMESWIDMRKLKKEYGTSSTRGMLRGLFSWSRGGARRSETDRSPYAVVDI